MGNACIFKPVFEILFGGYATPTKCVAFWRLALNSYLIIMMSQFLFLEAYPDRIRMCRQFFRFRKRDDIFMDRLQRLFRIINDARFFDKVIYTDSAEKNFAVPFVGSTWFGPAK